MLHFGPKQWASGDSGAQTISDELAGPSVDTVSAGEECLRFLLASRESMYMDFMRLASELRDEIQPVNTNFSEGYLADSSQNQHSYGWKKLIKYLHDNDTKVVTKDTCLSFLYHLHESGLAASTVNTIKSQITKPR